MDQLQRDLLDVLADVRMHLEYQKALGVRSIEISPPGQSAGEPVQRKVMMPGTGPAGGPETSESSGLVSVREELGNCVRCKLHKARKTVVFGEGSPNAALVFVGEGPGSEEDRQGRPFVGEAGELLTKIIENGMRLGRESVYICNVVKCRPPDNRNPEPDEIAACGPFLVKQLSSINPKVIVTLGNVPTQTLLNTKEGITRLRGRWQMYEGIPLMPTFHPAYLLRNPSDKKLVWEDIRKVMEKLGLLRP